MLDTMFQVYRGADARLVDRRCRTKTSIDDFCRLFFKRNQPLKSPHGYDRGEVVDTLDQWSKEHDWDGLIRRRIEMVQEKLLA